MVLSSPFVKFVTEILSLALLKNWVVSNIPTRAYTE